MAGVPSSTSGTPSLGGAVSAGHRPAIAPEPDVRHVQLVGELSAAGHAVPATLADIAFAGQPASIVFTSAEGVTTFGGAQADADDSTRRWLDNQFERLGKAHEAVNKPLRKLREELD